MTLETIGSNCFHHSMSLNEEETKFALPEGVHAVHDQANDVELAHFTGFSSKASGSLGASQPSAPVVKMALERKGGVKSASVPDELSMQAAALFAGMSFASFMSWQRRTIMDVLQMITSS